MSYTSSLLTPSIKVAILESNTKGIDYRTDFEHLLEFHDEIYMAHFTCGNDYYKALLESDEVLNEGVFGAISGFISIIVNTIRSMFNIIFGGKSSDDDDKPTSTITKAANTVAEKVKKSIGVSAKSIEEKQKTFNSMYQDGKLNGKKCKMKVYSFGLSNGQMIDISENTVIPNNDVLQNIKTCTGRVDTLIGLIKARGGVVTNSNDEDLENAKRSYGNIASQMNECAKQIKSLDVANYAIFKPKEEELGADAIYQYTTRLNVFHDFETQLKKYNERNFPAVADGLKKLEDVKAILDKQSEDSKNNSRITNLISLTKTVLDAYNGILTEYMDKVKNFVDKAIIHFGYQYNNLNKAVSDMIGTINDTVGGEVAEQAQLEAAILDEQLSNSLAATMYDLKWSYMDAYRQGYVNEAVILSENAIDKDKKLIELNEAISSKVKSAFNTAVEKIRKLFATFMEKLRRNVTSTKNYLTKYKKYILGTTFTYNYKGKDIINGMYRVMNYVVPAFDYAAIERYLTNPKTFFDNQLKPKNDDPKVRRGNQPQVNVDNSDQALSQIGEYFKEWFGVTPIEQDILASDLQNSIKDIYDFMYDISKIEKSVNDSIKNIEGLRERALAQAGIERAQESATYLNHFPVLLEVEKVTNPQPAANNTNQSTTPSNYTGATAGQMTNVASTGVQKDGQEQYGVGQTKKEDVEAKCNVYIKCVTKVLQAKLTAIEFLRNEFMTIFKDLVERNVEGDANPSGITANNTERMPVKPQPVPQQ